MARLVLLNGPPGIGKSTVARLVAEERPGTLVCDVDLLRTLIGGWVGDFVGAGTRIRPAAQALIAGYLAGSGDVLLPQMLLPVTEVEQFEAVAHGVGAEFTELMLTCPHDSVVARFHRRGAADPSPWHEQVRAIIEEEGGDDRLLECHDRLRDLLAERPHTVVIDSAEGEPAATCRAVLSVLGPAGRN